MFMVGSPINFSEGKFSFNQIIQLMQTTYICMSESEQQCKCPWMTPSSFSRGFPIRIQSRDPFVGECTLTIHGTFSKNILLPQVFAEKQNSIIHLLKQDLKKKQSTHRQIHLKRATTHSKATRRHTTGVGICAKPKVNPSINLGRLQLSLQVYQL